MTFNQLLKSKLFLLFLVAMLVSGGYFFARELQRQYKIQGDLVTLEEEVKSLESRNQELQDLIAYFKTDSFQEKEVRSKLNLKRPGEHVVAVPDGVVLGTSLEEKSVDESQKNWRLWWDYFFEK